VCCGADGSSDTNVNSGYPQLGAGGYWGWIDDAGTLNNIDAGNVLSGNAGEGGEP